jgi:hypothetical protein
MITLVIACICSGPLRAGGWERFDQGIDLLFDPGRTAFDVRLYELFPNQNFNSVNGRPETVSTAPDFFVLPLILNSHRSITRHAMRAIDSHLASTILIQQPGAKPILPFQAPSTSNNLD